MIAQLNGIAQVWWQWMAGMFWQVSLFIILVTLLDMAIRRWAWPQVRYVLWGLVFIKLIIPPTWQMPTSIVSWIQPKVEKQISIQILPIEVTADYQEISISDLSSSTQISESAVKNEKPTWQAIVLMTWFAGMITFSLILIIKLSRLPRRSKKRDDQTVPEWFQGVLSKTAQVIKLRKTPTLVFSKHVKSPAVYGILKPVLLLPDGCLDHLSKEQTEHVLMHELCHLKRGDLLVHWFCLVLQVVYWFNPMLIWTRRQMRHVCEICCDLSVANLLREKTTAYRDTLLATARELLTESIEPGLGLLGVFEEPFRLVSRLKWLEKKTWGNRKRKIAATVCTNLIMIVCVMPMAGFTQTQAQNKVSDAAVKSETSGKEAIEGPALDTYKEQITSLIYNNWYYPAAMQDRKDIEAILLLKVNADGAILKYEFVKKSGDSTFDQSVLQAIERSNPMIPLPEGCGKSYEEIEVKFNLKKYESNGQQIQAENGINQTTIYYDALIMEVDADKELELDAETIGPSTGSQTEENEHYAERVGFNPGIQPDEGNPYDIERVEVIRGSQDIPSPDKYRGAFSARVTVSTIVTDSYPKGNRSESQVEGSGSSTVSINAEEEIGKPPDLPPGSYENMSVMDAVTTEAPPFPLSFSLFKDDISIEGESFPDIEAVFEKMKTEAGVNILGTPQTITLDDEGIKTPWNMGYDKTSTVLLGIKSEVMNGGGVQKMILLNISPPNDEKSKEAHPYMRVKASLTEIEEGGAMVMICDPRILADSMNEEYTESGKKLYVFLAPHVENQ